MKNSGNIPYALTEIVRRLISEWNVLQMLPKVDGNYRGAPEGTCMSGGGIEFLCISLGKDSYI